MDANISYEFRLEILKMNALKYLYDFLKKLSLSFEVPIDFFRKYRESCSINEEKTLKKTVKRLKN